MEPRQRRPRRYWMSLKKNPFFEALFVTAPPTLAETHAIFLIRTTSFNYSWCQKKHNEFEKCMRLSVKPWSQRGIFTGIFFLCRGSGMNGGLELEVPHKYRMTCLSVTTSLWCNWCCFGSFAYSRPCNFIPSSYSVKLCKVWHVSWDITPQQVQCWQYMLIMSIGHTVIRGHNQWLRSMAIRYVIANGHN